jgi:hypothetical protein
MICRPHGRKPTLALWMLVALADVALLAAAAGPRTVLLIAGLVTVAVVTTAVWVMHHRATPHPAHRAAHLVMRRRA